MNNNNNNNNNNFQNFGEIIEKIMIENHIKQIEIAKKLNISKQTINQTLKNCDKMTFANMERIAEALNYKIKIELIPIAENQKESKQNTSTENEEKEIETDLKKKLKSLKPLDI